MIGICFIYFLSILFWKACTPTSSISLTVNTEHPPHLCAETSCLAMKSLILWSTRLTYARKGKNPSGLDLEYCNRQTLTLFLHAYLDKIRLLVFGYIDNKKNTANNATWPKWMLNPQPVTHGSLIQLHGWYCPHHLLTVNEILNKT